MGYENYDDWKLANPYDECRVKFVPVKVEVEIFDLGQHVIDEFKNETSRINSEDGETSLTTTITVDALLICDDFEKVYYARDEDVENAVAEYLGKGCEYEIIDWWRV